MTFELGLAIALVLVAVLSGMLGFGGARSRTASFARMFFYVILLLSTITFVIAVLGVMQII